MRRKALALALATSMVAACFAGCGKSSDDSKNDTKAPSQQSGDKETQAGDPETDAPAVDVAFDEEKGKKAIETLKGTTEGTVKLTLWCSETEAYQSVMKDIVEAFKAEYSDVDFDITIGQCSESKAKDTVLEDPEAAADVFVFADDQVASLVDAAALQPIKVMYTYDVNAVNSTSTVAAATMSDTMYAYPLTASNGYFLYYDPEYFTAEQVGSWESIIEVAEKANKKVGFDFGNAWYLYGFFAGAGLDLSKNADGTNTCNWNSKDNAPTGAEVCEAIAKICESPAVISIGNAEATPMAKDGDLIAYVDGTWDVNAFVEAYGENYGAAKLPTFTAGGKECQMGSYAGYKFVGVNSYSDNIGWSMIFAEYITSEASQTKIAAATGEGPANTKSASTIESPALGALAAQSEFADQQVVGDNFWAPANSLGQQLADKENKVSDYQKAIDEAVAAITQ